MGHRRRRARSPAAACTTPFAVQADGAGNVWVDNGSLDPSAQGTLTKITPDGVAVGPFSAPSMRSPQGMAFDSAGGFTNGGPQHVTAVQVDPSGNVWVANNWKTIKPIVGGDGLVELIGAAAPVATPLIGLPRRP